MLVPSQYSINLQQNTHEDSINVLFFSDIQLLHFINQRVQLNSDIYFETRNVIFLSFLFFWPPNIYIFIAVALDETSILVALHFLMENIYQSVSLGGATSSSANKVLCLLTFTYRIDVKRGNSAS